VRSDVLLAHGLGPGDKVGEGGESEVYALDDERVLRLHRHESSAYVRGVAALYDGLDRTAVPYALPQVLEVHQDGEVSWSIERRLDGRPLDGLLPVLRGEERARALTAYVDGAAAFGRLGLPTGWEGRFGELCTAEGLRADRWGDLLAERLRLQRDRARPIVAGEAPDFERAARHVIAEARTEPDRPPTLVHGDWFPGNVLMGDDLQVSAAIDLGWLSVVGADDHDVRSAVVFNEVRPWQQPEDLQVLLAAAARHLGATAGAAIERSRRYEQLRFAFVTEDEHLHRWCLAGLRAVADGLPPAG
jgi:fructosamine-3-kinase